MAELGGHPGRKCDGEPGYETFWNGSEVLSNITGFLKQVQYLRDSGQIQLGDDRWTALFGELEKWKRTPDAAEPIVA